MNDTFGALRHAINMLLIVLLRELYDTTLELVLLCSILHFLHALCSVLLHDIVILKVPIILDLLLNLLGVEIGIVVVGLDALLLVEEDLLRCWYVLARLPVAFCYLKVLPFRCDSSCHLYFFLIFWIKTIVFFNILDI